MALDQDLDSLRPELVGQVKERYKVGEHFARAYLSYWQRTRKRTYQSLEEILSLPAPEPMWFDYAMTTNQRAQHFSDYLKSYNQGGTGRYLDVGCGFGGYPCAFAKAGMESYGIEIDPVRIELSKANLKDHGLPDRIFDLSILDDGLPERLGRFDLITCMDVIEHVLDVPKAMENLAGLLNPGGALLLEIPNKDSIAFVTSDGHFNLFGITQLPRNDAIEYHKANFSFDYDVGYYRPLDFYVRFFESKGFNCLRIASPYHPQREVKAIWGLLADLNVTYFKFLLNTAPKLSIKLNFVLHSRFMAYGLAMVYRSIRMMLDRREKPYFQERYLTDFWTLLVKGTGKND